MEVVRELAHESQRYSLLFVSSRTVIFQMLLTARAPVLALILPLCDVWARQRFVPSPITSDDVIRRSASIPLSTNRDVMHGFPLIDFV